MASLTLQNVPDDLVKRLALAAEARHRDLSLEAVNRLDNSFGSPRVSEPRSHAELVELARRVRGEGEGSWLTPEFIRQAREYGRE
jgi:plasmid stability protein